MGVPEGVGHTLQSSFVRQREDRSVVSQVMCPLCRGLNEADAPSCSTCGALFARAPGDAGPPPSADGMSFAPAPLTPPEAPPVSTWQGDAAFEAASLPSSSGVAAPEPTSNPYAPIPPTAPLTPAP